MNDISVLKKTVFYISLPIFFINFMFPMLALKFGSTSLELGIMFSILSLLSIIIKPFVGCFVDKNGACKSLVLGSMLYIFNLILLYLCTSYDILLFSSVIKSISASFIWIAIDNMVIWFSDSNNISLNSGKIDKWNTSGAAMGSFVGGILYFNKMVNTNTIFLIYIIFILVGLIDLFKNLNKFKLYEKKIFLEKPMDDPLKEQKYIPSLKLFKSLDSPLKFYCIIIFISSISASIFSPVFLSYLSLNLNMDYFTVSYLYLPMTFISILFSEKIGVLVDKRNKKPLIITCIILNIVYWVIFPNIDSFYSLLIVYTLMGIACIFSNLAINSLEKTLVGNTNTATKVGTMCLFSGLGSSIGSFVGGALYSSLGLYVIVACIIALSSLTLLLYFRLFKRFSFI